jgi:hypothetical protein
VVQRRCAKADQNLAGAWHGIGRVLDHEDIGAAVFVDPNRAHRGRLSV